MAFYEYNNDLMNFDIFTKFDGLMWKKDIKNINNRTKINQNKNRLDNHRETIF